MHTVQTESTQTMDASSRRERKQQESAQHIAACAFTLFEQHGYHTVSMEDIAREADVAKGTLYRRFPVKEAILTYRFQQEFQALTPELSQLLAAQPNCRSRLRAYFQGVASWSLRHKAYLQPWLAYRYAHAFDHEVPRSGASHILHTILSAGISNGELRSDIPLEQMLVSLEYLHSSVLMRWLNHEEEDIAMALERMLSLFLEGSELHHAA